MCEAREGIIAPGAGAAGRCKHQDVVLGSELRSSRTAVPTLHHRPTSLPTVFSLQNSLYVGFFKVSHHLHGILTLVCVSASLSIELVSVPKVLYRWEVL